MSGYEQSLEASLRAEEPFMLRILVISMRGWADGKELVALILDTGHCVRRDIPVMFSISAILTWSQDGFHLQCFFLTELRSSIPSCYKMHQRFWVIAKSRGISNILITPVFVGVRVSSISNFKTEWKSTTLQQWENITSTYLMEENASKAFTATYVLLIVWKSTVFCNVYDKKQLWSFTICCLTDNYGMAKSMICVIRFWITY